MLRRYLSLLSKNTASQVVLVVNRCGFSLWIGKILWRRKWHPTQVFLPAKFHGQRSLTGYSPWGHKESDTTEWLSLFTFKGLLVRTPCMCAVLSHVQLLVTLWTISLSGSSVHGIFQARIPEWVAISSCRGSSRPRNQTHVSCVSCIAGRLFNSEPSEAPLIYLCLH